MRFPILITKRNLVGNSELWLPFEKMIFVDAYDWWFLQVASIRYKSQSKWLSECNSHSSGVVDWHSSFSLAFLSTRESKLRTFQFKFRHRRLATNSYLFKISVRSDNLWSFCKERLETILHMLWDCIFVQVFWNGFRQWMNNKPCFLKAGFH